MSMEQIRRQYGVPAKRGGRVRFSPGVGTPPVEGTIKGSHYGRLRVLLDGSKRTAIFHPTWALLYLIPED